ncbi:putative Lipoprotein [Pseudomonas syringae pv. helianthi]|nr:putative Lipoprotein [Pseudomonas syringae pv. helianthi]KPY86424.1 putative Lipoprotein [Pseudomonas syringae pv. tagetis]RMW15364.1 putative Lipoprotein [Pseudomonas syringae pv. tagetis]RMW21599.1 putative Lipoprotein [Pseudomonas syringae pv. tagetis]
MMNSFLRSLAGGVLVAACGIGAAQAQTLPGSTLDNSASSNPYNSPIKRSNPNSRQGTESITPRAPGPNIAPPVRKPSLENGGIGNGYPTRQTAPRPSTPTTDPKRPH